MQDGQIVNETRLARSLSARAGLPAVSAVGLLAYGLCTAGLHQLEVQRLWVLPAVLIALITASRASQRAQDSVPVPLHLLITLLLFQGLMSPALEVSLPMAWLFAMPILFLAVMPRSLSQVGARLLPWILLVPAVLWSVPALIFHGFLGEPAGDTRDPNVVGDVWALVLLFAAHQGVGPKARLLTLMLLASGTFVISIGLFFALEARIAGVLAGLGLLALGGFRRDPRFIALILAYGLGWLSAGLSSRIFL